MRVFRMELRIKNEDSDRKNCCKHSESSDTTLWDDGVMTELWRGRSQMEGADMEGMKGFFSGSYAVRSVPGAGLAILGAVRVGRQAVVRGHVWGVLWWVIVLGEGRAGGHAVALLERTEWQQRHCLLTGDTELVSFQGSHVLLLDCTDCFCCLVLSRQWAVIKPIRALSINTAAGTEADENEPKQFKGNSAVFKPGPLHLLQDFRLLERDLCFWWNKMDFTL